MGIQAACMVPHPPLILPEVGHGEERKISDTVNAYHKAAQFIASYKPETVIVLSPHQIMYADYFHISPGASAVGDMSRFGAPEVKISVDYDKDLVNLISHLAVQKAVPAGILGEKTPELDHGTLVPLYFLNQYLTDYKLVRIGLSGFPLTTHYALGKCIKEAVEQLGRNAVIIASGDLSHHLKKDGPYGLSKEGPEYDKLIMEVMGSGDFGRLLDFSEDFLDCAGECGHRSFTIMAGAFDETEVRSERLSYEGPFGVGYGVCTYRAEGKNQKRNYKERFDEVLRERMTALREREDAYIRLARKTVELYVTKKERPEVPSGLPQEMYEKQAGVFVSIKKHGRLRGCIGTIHPVEDSIAKEIIENAVSASSFDSRFSPITPEELDDLVISVDVLGDTEKISSPDELDVKRYGVVVTKGYRRGLLLPNLSGVDTVEEQIAIAKQKAGIAENEKVELERFEVIRHE